MTALYGTEGMGTGPNSNLTMVKIEIWTDSNANTIPINYKMHINNGEWKVIDITVDGISLVRTYRGLFASKIRKHGLDSLITQVDGAQLQTC